MTGSHISLFSGVGMTDIAAEQAGYKTIATAEVDPWNRKVIAKRFPGAVHYDDVHKVKVEDWRMPGGTEFFHRPLLVTGGFPCQDISSAGTGAGLSGARSGLWGEFARVISEFRPDVVLIENSPMLRSRGLNRVLADLETLEYDARWDCLPAASLGAPHMRDRIFIVATRQTAASAKTSYRTPGAFGYAVTAGCYGTVRQASADHVTGAELTKLPRSGKMIGGILIETTPLATIKDAKKAILAHAVPCPATPTGAWPTPAASNPQDGEAPESWLARRETLKAKGINGNGAGMPLNIAVRLFPTPTKSDGSGGPGETPKRTGGPNLRTVIDREEGNGRLNPEWVEWMMGLPGGWTDPTLSNDHLYAHMGWGSEHGIFRTVPNGVKDRAKRIRALGNGLVPQAAYFALTNLKPE